MILREFHHISARAAAAAASGSKIWFKNVFKQCNVLSIDSQSQE